MVLGALLEPFGFVASIIEIANALGINTPAQQAQWDALKKSITECRDAVRETPKYIQNSMNEIKSQIHHTSVIEVRSRLTSVSAVPTAKVDLLIRLLLYIKMGAPDTVFAIMVKYKVGTRAATLGFSGMSSDAVERMCRKVDRFYRGLSLVDTKKTTYINVRIRGRSNIDVENFCLAALTKLASDVCGLKGKMTLKNRADCKIEPAEEHIVVLMCPKSEDCGHTECDQIRRIFVIGDTRTGKSTLGNAILKRELFSVSKGMTGTMKVECGEVVEERGSTLWKMEVYDTPGLNDKDGLDEYYLCAIEDEIRTLQRASTLIMTLSVDEGIKNSSFDSLKTYKELFGRSIASMLLVVLTINEPADTEGLKFTKDLNWPTISGKRKEILETNVFCVSLHDLRLKKRSASHLTVKNILQSCRNMEMKIIESLEREYRDLRKSLQRKSVKLDDDIQYLLNSGWLRYQKLASDYSCCSTMKMLFKEDTLGKYDAFELKHSSPKNRLISAVTLGKVDRIRKVLLVVETAGPQSKKAWQEIKDMYRRKGTSTNCMQQFANIVKEQQLGLIVRDEGTFNKGMLGVHVYNLTVINPVSQAHEELMTYLERETGDQKFELREDMVNDLLKSVMKFSVGRNQPSSSKRTVEKSQDRK